jgi:hypothetical protein
MRSIVGSIEGEYRRHKTLAERALEQLPEAALSQALGGNSVATLVWHISGNLASRFTDFLTTDGEKPWRDRDSEFVARAVSHADLTAKLDAGFAVLFAALAEVEDEGLHAEVKIRGMALTVHDALHRSLAHTAYHVGQIVLIGKAVRGDDWKWLTIPPGGSAAYNANPVGEKPR